MAGPAGVPLARHAARRRELMRMAGGDAIVILPAAPERVRSRDTHHPYRPDSDLLYLAGFAEPSAVLVLVPGRAHGEVLLFCRERDAAREAWDGPRLGPEDAVAAMGLDDAFPIDDIDDILPGLIEGRSRVYYHFGRDTDFDLKLIGWVNRVRAQVRLGAQAPHEFLELGHLLDEMRLFKDADELKLMERAARISIEAHQAVMRAARPGMHEYELQGELEYVFRRHGAEPAYGSIVGAGANACVLHYVANRARVREGDLVLVDARPGVAWARLHEAAVEVLVDGLLSLGLLRGKAAELITNGSYRRFYPHKTGHWLGLDVHDVGEYRLDGESRLLEPGMVFTIEPGLYIPAGDTSVPARWRGLGVRLEDNVAITRDGHRVLTAGLARSAGDIEALMAAR
jgi:Xaa-Pro aminopeptidase